MRNSCCIDLTIDSGCLRSKDGTCFTSTAAHFCSDRVNAMYCGTKSLRTGFPTLKLSHQLVAVPQSRSYATANFDKWLDFSESCANLIAHVIYSVEQAERFSVPTAVQCIP